MGLRDRLTAIAKAAAFGTTSMQQGATSVTNIDGLVSQITGPTTPNLQGGLTQGGLTPGVGAPGQMGPGAAPMPTPLGSDPRQFAYRVGYNLPSVPGEGRASFALLRDVASVEWLTRKAIEVRKNQIHNLKLDIVAIDRKSQVRMKRTMEKNEELISEVKEFFKRPDGRNTFQSWMAALLEDHLVYDAVAIEKVRNLDPDAGPKHPTEEGVRLGKLIALQRVDGTTIKPLLDDGGRIPLAPLAAYQQYLYGIPRASFTTQQLIYAVKNVRNHTPYGFSPVEQFLTLVNIVLRYWAWVGAKYTDGTLPEGIAEAPATWTTAQIAELNEYWDALLAGDPKALRKLHFVPGGFKWHQFKDAMFDDKFSRLLIEMTAIAFDVTPQEMGFTMGGKGGGSLTGKSAGESAEELSFRRGPQPTVYWIINEILNPILWEEFGATDLEWTVVDDQKASEEDHAKALDVSVKNATVSLDQAIEENGGEPIGIGRLMVVGNMVLGEEDLKLITDQGWPAFQKKVANAMPQAPAGNPNGKPLTMQQGKPGVSGGHSGSGPGSPTNPQLEPEHEQATGSGRRVSGSA